MVDAGAPRRGTRSSSTENELLESFLVNPTGKFVIGGPVGDAGLTGRKIIVDTYGGMARHGGGAFSGKDPSKVDRSAAYAARYVAKNVVAAGLAERCEVQVAYAIGVAHPVSLMVETFGTGKLPDAEISRLVEESSTCARAPSARYLDLHRPIFQKTAAYGHFGRDGRRLHLGADRPRRRAAQRRRPRAPSALGLGAAARPVRRALAACAEAVGSPAAPVAPRRLVDPLDDLARGRRRRRRRSWSRRSPAVSKSTSPICMIRW